MPGGGAEASPLRSSRFGPLTTRPAPVVPAPRKAIHVSTLWPRYGDGAGAIAVTSSDSLKPNGTVCGPLSWGWNVTVNVQVRPGGTATPAVAAAEVARTPVGHGTPLSSGPGPTR